MIRNYIKIAWRNILRYKSNTAFNVLGLSLGIVCTLFLTLYITNELSYDKSFSKHDRIYRMVYTEWSKTAPPLADALQHYFPEIEATTRFAQAGTNVVRTTNNAQMEMSGFYTDSSTTKMFDLKSIAGNAFEALKEPSAVVLTKSTAKKLFGNKNPLGEKLVFQDEETMWVRAVIDDLPQNTHLQFDFLASMPTFYTIVEKAYSGWTQSKGWMFGWTYIQLNRKASINRINRELIPFYTTYLKGEASDEQIKEFAATARTQPLTDIHLKSDLIQEMSANGSMTYIYVFMAVEALILIMACINFINLFTTQTLRRLKEVGVRKIIGAKRSQLIFQFLMEAFLLTLIASLFALAFYKLLLPFYNRLTDGNYSVMAIFDKENLIVLFAIIFIVTLVSGLFPSLFASSFLPVKALKAIKTPNTIAVYIRKALVIFQFMIAGLLITSTLLIYQQMQYFQHKKLGFDKNQIVVATLYGDFKKNVETDPTILQQEFLSNPNVLSVARTSNIIGDPLSVEFIAPSNNPENKDFGTLKVIRVDENFLNALNIPLKQGRNFSNARNDSNAFILNEQAVARLELKDPIHQSLTNHTIERQGNIVGVIKDFNFESLHHKIEPLVLEYAPKNTGSLLIKIRGGSIEKTLSFLKKKVQEVSPNTLFSYTFLDEKINTLYKKEHNMSSIVLVFTVLGIVISCLGLLGLIGYSTEMRTKEIGIRKIIGASIQQLLALLSKDTILLVIAGNLLAWPTAWFFIQKWLEYFAYKIAIPWWAFLLSILLTLVIAIFTVIWQCLKTVYTNPVDSLRNE
ncbi:ABC transporter permease [Olivibacter ginsenosidimutans]|uniref:ABC transporter permease n=1 Tax=Olivibacter ginsenosidimutans TaxID=1176537 RepID=A0ABP9C0A8_9SPHI